jgi:hypothetical protein
MKPTLGGASFVWRNNDQDYHIKETLTCLVDLCDEVVVAAGGTDGTFEDVFHFIQEMALFSDRWEKVRLIEITEDMWNGQHGREKLSYFSNICIELLTTDYTCYIQADEVLSEEAFPYVRMAIETGKEAFFMRRLNLWKDHNHMLNVSQDRKPCSTEVIRLAKTKYRCVDDAESIGVPECYVFGDIDTMVIYHTGFIRNGKKMLVKVKHMLTEVFGWSNDVRAENCDTFIPERFFSDADIVPIPKPLPKFIQQWAKERYPDKPTQSNP